MYVDDIFITAYKQNEIAKFMDEIETTFKVKGEKLLSKFLGISRRDLGKSIKLDYKEMIKKMHKIYNK